MKIAKILIAVFLLMVIFPLPVRAEEKDTVDGIYSFLPDSAKDRLDQNGLSGDWAEKLDTAGFFSLVASFFKEGFSSPLSALCKTVSVLIIACLITSYSPEGKTGEAAQSVCAVSIALILAADLYEIIAAAKEALSGASIFMSGSVPLFAAVKAASGKPLSVSGGSAVLLFACQALSYLCSFVLAPFMNSYLALGLCSSVGGKNTSSGIMDTVKKVTMWVLSLCVSVFLFILSAKGIAGRNGDTLAMKTAKFLLGTTVPVVGGALSESASSVAASLSAMSGTAGMYIILGVLVIMLPLLCELVCWRLALILVRHLSVLFSAPVVNNLVEALQGVISLLLGFSLLSLALLIISTGVLISL